MQDHPVLSQVVLGYSPMIDRQRAVVATRLTIFPAAAGAAPDAAALLAALAEVWPAPAAAQSPPLALTLRQLQPGAAPAPGSASAAAALQPVSLNIAGEALLLAIIAAQPPAHLMVEVPAFIAAEPRNAAGLQALHAAGSTLLLKGLASTQVPRAVLACFGHSIVDADAAADVAAAASGLRRVQAGTRTPAALASAFQHGAVAAFGWPIDGVVQRPAGRSGVPQDIQVVLELINGVDAEQPVQRLEAVLKKDPTLAFRLMRYLNSPAFGLSVEISSFGHALMMLGYQRLKRWLALLLASSAKDANAKPLMYAAVRRGLLMEELVRSSGDAEMRGELFICGVFSLLDHLLQQPFEMLFKSVPVPERVRQALLDGSGPFQPYLELAQAIEQESLFDIRECAERLFLTQAEINRALIGALAAGRALDESAGGNR